MADNAKFGMLRRILNALGLSEETVNDLIDWITDRLADEQQESGGEAPAPVFPYRTRDDFLSPSERNFYQVLKSVAGSRLLICPKVSLSDLFYVKSRDPREYRVYTNKIDRKHVDFLLCNPETLIPVAGIELDDKSHERADRKQRDDFVEGVFAAAKLALLRVRVQRGYQPQELAALLGPLLSSSPDETEMPAKTTAAGADALDRAASMGSPHNSEGLDSSPPACPKCGSEMVLRMAKRGDNQGQWFWGCPNYPRCRTMAPYEPAGQIAASIEN